MYSFYCKTCGYSFVSPSKEEVKKHKKEHKCTFLVRNNKYYSRPELYEYIVKTSQK